MNNNCRVKDIQKKQPFFEPIIDKDKHLVLDRKGNIYFDDDTSLCINFKYEVVIKMTYLDIFLNQRKEALVITKTPEEIYK